MSYKSLVTLNPHAVGVVGGCLNYACNFGGVPHGVEYASQSWQMAVNHNAVHRDQNFLPVPEPVFFSYELNHVEEGHVVWHVPNLGFYSAPYTKRKGAQYQDVNATHALLPSIAEVERIYGVKFLGRASELNGHKVYETVADPAPVSHPAPAPTPAPVHEAPAPAQPAAPAPADNHPKLGDHVTTTATHDQNGTELNLAIINDGHSVWSETNHLGHAVLTKDGVVRCGVPVESLRKVG